MSRSCGTRARRSTARARPECRAWVEARKDDLHPGSAGKIVAELDRQLARIARTGPGNKFRREKLGEIREHVAKRAALLKYDELIARDLEIGTGPVEGAIKNLMYKRMDHGGVRWIKERAEALLQLRCIDANGDWEALTLRPSAPGALSIELPCGVP